MSTISPAARPSRLGAVPRPASALSDDELRSLFIRWRDDRDPRSREMLVERFLPLARRLAMRYVGASEPLDDLVQIASYGLVKAIDRFDPDRGLKFSSFAVPTILGELRRYFRDCGWSVHVPRAAQERALRAEKAIKELDAQGGGAATVTMLAEYLEWPVADVLEALEANAGHHAKSLDAPVTHDDGDSVTVLDTIGGPDENFDMVDARLTFAHAIARLPMHTRRVIRLRFVDDLTQTEIAERLGVSQMQVSRLLRSALQQVREAGSESVHTAAPQRVADLSGRGHD